MIYRLIIGCTRKRFYYRSFFWEGIPVVAKQNKRYIAIEKIKNILIFLKRELMRFYFNFGYSHLLNLTKLKILAFFLIPYLAFYFIFLSLSFFPIIGTAYSGDTGKSPLLRIFVCLQPLKLLLYPNNIFLGQHQKYPESSTQYFLLLYIHNYFVFIIRIMCTCPSTLF